MSATYSLVTIDRPKDSILAHSHRQAQKRRRALGVYIKLYQVSEEHAKLLPHAVQRHNMSTSGPWDTLWMMWKEIATSLAARHGGAINLSGGGVASSAGTRASRSRGGIRL